jgi:hypothetical protein
MYVNVFHLKTSNGLAHNAEYFYNNGSLSLDDLLWVIMMYKIISVQIHATNCDVSGQNTGIVNTLHHDKKVTLIGWLPEECMNCKNPDFPDH